MTSKEATPAVSDAKSSSPTKNDANGVTFTPKEEQLLKVAMTHCLKSGPPEIDYQKFVKYGEFNTIKTAQNTWGKIKQKLIKAAGPQKEGEGDEDGEANGNATPKTPTKATPKKRASPTKKKVTAEADGDDAEDGAADEGSPKKKARKPIAKKTPVKKVKKEDTEDEEMGDGDVDVKAEAAKEE